MSGDRPVGRTPATVAYMMSRFPKVSETFILNEMVELEALGVDVRVMPLVRERAAVVHPEVRGLLERLEVPAAHIPGVLLAQLQWLVRRPRAYLRAWARAVAGNARSPKFLLRALVTVPVAAWFARRAQATGVEHVHAHYATHPALAAYVVGELTGIPYTVTAHAHDLYVDTPMLREKLSAARAVVTISEYNRELIGRLCGPEVAARTTVIHTGADLSAFRPRDEDARQDGPFTIVCVASLQDYKGQTHLIEACRLLAADGAGLRCLLVGEGEDRAALERQIAAAGLAGTVELLGAQPRERVAELMAAADVFALPSVVTASGKMEGIPVVLMEAMAVGTPVVATRLSGVPELVEDGVTGLLAEPGDAAGLAQALRVVRDDPEAARARAAAGGEHVRAAFDLRAGVRELHALITA